MIVKNLILPINESPAKTITIPAKIKSGIWEAVSEAVLEEYAIQVIYLSRKKNDAKDYTLHPQAIVVKDSVSYLVATVNDYDEILQFALHRIQEAEPSNKTYRRYDDFNINEYIDKGAFSYRQSANIQTLKARVKSEIAWLLSETPISEDQKLTQAEDDWYWLNASVTDDKQTLWWIQGYGAAIDVHEPIEWREYIHDQAREILGLS